jgi:hypothetical protein
MKSKGAKTPKTPKHQTSREHAETFPQVKGKVIESVEASADDSDLYVTINFNDTTTLNFNIMVDEPTFNVKADYGRWKAGNFHPIKHWPRISTQR